MLNARDVVGTPVLSGFRKTRKQWQSDAWGFTVTMKTAHLERPLHVTYLNLKRNMANEWYSSSRQPRMSENSLVYMTCACALTPIGLLILICDAKPQQGLLSLLHLPKHQVLFV